MGHFSSKVLVKSIDLTKTNVKNSKFKQRFIIQPLLSQVIFQTSVQKCNQNDVQNFKTFLKSEKNVLKRNVKNRKRLEKELTSFITQPKILSVQAEEYLLNVLSNAEKIQTKPVLIERVIIPKLRTVYHENLILQKRKRYQFWTGCLHNSYMFILSLLKPKLSAKTLRKSLKLKSVQGLERAHIFSLDLAVKLWKFKFGHKFVKQNDLISLKTSLNTNANLIYTCRHTNRVLHVKYDEEIGNAIINNENVALSSGAKMRSKEIMKLLTQIQTDSIKIQSFYDECEREIARLLQFS